MSPIHRAALWVGALLASLAMASPAAAMSLAPWDPELAPSTTEIPLVLALGAAAGQSAAPVYRLVEEPPPSAALVPRDAELLRTSYERERRADVLSASRAVLVEFVAP